MLGLLWKYDYITYMFMEGRKSKLCSWGFVSFHQTRLHLAQTAIKLSGQHPLLKLGLKYWETDEATNTNMKIRMLLFYIRGSFSSEFRKLFFFSLILQSNYKSSIIHQLESGRSWISIYKADMNCLFLFHVTAGNRSSEGWFWPQPVFQRNFYGSVLLVLVGESIKRRTSVSPCF